MKRWTFTLVLLLVLPVSALAELETQIEKQSYALGVQLGKDLERGAVEVDPELVADGIRDALTANEIKLSEQEIMETMQAMQSEMMEKQMAKRQQAAEENLAEGEAFLTANKTRDEVKTTESGLQYMVVEKGSGPSPGPEDKVSVHYKGQLIDGTVFDSSYQRGEPATFPVGGVIPGWTEALQLMKEGGKYKLFIPSELAYGERGAGQQIGPNETLIFEVELLDIEETGQSGQ